MQAAWPKFDVDGGGTLWHASKDIAKYDADKEWVRKPAWESFAQEMGVDWDTMNKKYAEAQVGA